MAPAKKPFFLFIRDIDVEDQEEYEAFKFYWERGLSRVAGVTGWDEQERHYTHIYQASWPYDESRNTKMFNVSTEAFFQLLWENNFDRWVAQLSWLQNHPGQKLPKRTAANKHLPLYKGRFTNQDGGQQRMGGWTFAGIGRFNAIYDQIQEAKYKNPTNPSEDEIKENWIEVETKFLAKLRDELGLQATNAREERNNRRRRNNEVQPQPERRVRPRGFPF